MADPIKNALIEKAIKELKQVIVNLEAIDQQLPDIIGSDAKDFFSAEYKVSRNTLSKFSNINQLNEDSLRNLLQQFENIKAHSQQMIGALNRRDLTFHYKQRSAYLDQGIQNSLKILNPEQHIKNLEQKVIKQEQETKQAQKEKQEAQQKESITQKENADTALLKSARFFETTSLKHQKLSKRWLCFTAISFTATLLANAILLYFALQNQPEFGKDSLYQFTRVTAMSIFFLSLLFSITFWCGRIYKSNMHLLTINKHKAISLRVAGNAYLGSLSDGTKDLIMTEASKAIFSDPQTGLISDKSSNNSLTITDLVKPPSS